MNVLLTKLESSHQNLRTDVVKGATEALPAIGQSFLLVAEALDKKLRDLGGCRIIKTSPVTTVLRSDETNLIHFRTVNSKYELEVLDEKN